MAAEKVGGSTQGAFLIATVRGDVHDIGKNIVGVVLACNNYAVTDLGVMTPSERIVSEALRLKPDFIGLSGLITPSLDEMINVAQELKRAGISTPLLIGGATTSKEHTAIKLAQHYDGPMVHVGDASLVTTVCSDLLNPAKRGGVVGDLKVEQAEMREAYEKQQPAEVIPLAEARKRPLVTTAPVQPVPRKTGVTLFERIDPAAVAEIIDWTPFFVTWSLKVRSRRSLSQPSMAAKPASSSTMPAANSTTSSAATACTSAASSASGPPAAWTMMSRSMPTKLRPSRLAASTSSVTSGRDRRSPRAGRSRTSSRPRRETTLAPSP